MSQLPDADLLQVRDALRGHPVRVDAAGKGRGLRFTYTGGEHGLAELGIGFEIPCPTSRGTVPAGLCPPLGKTPFMGRYKELAASCWPRGAPAIEAVQLQVALCGHDVVASARRTVAAYNALLHLAAAVVVLRQDPRDAEGIADVWSRIVESITGPAAHNARLVEEWQGDIVVMAQNGPAGADLGPAVLAAARSARVRLDESRSQLGRRIAREIVAKEFDRWAESRPTSRPPEAKLWKWPWTERKPADVLLGLLAMKVFENTAGDPDRWDLETWPFREGFRFKHAPVGERRIASGGLLKVWPRWLDDSVNEGNDGRLTVKADAASRTLTVQYLLTDIAERWGIVGRGDDTVNPDSLRKMLRQAIADPDVAAELLPQLRLVEKSRGLVKRGEYRWRYEAPKPRLMDVSDLVPLLTAVAVRYEEGEGRTFEVAPGQEEAP